MARFDLATRPLSRTATVCSLPICQNHWFLGVVQFRKLHVTGGMSLSFGRQIGGIL